MKQLQLNIVSPEREIFKGEITSITLPGTMGIFSILPHHAPIVASLKEGQVVYVTVDGDENILDIHSGFVEMSNQEVSVCIS